MRVLVVGSGAREHAICQAVFKSKKCSKLYAAPGNAGIADVAECLPIHIEDIHKIVLTVAEKKIDFVIVGPENPLALGLVDELTAASVKCFGPTKDAAELESSKGFMKDLCARAGVPTAVYKRFSDIDAARNYILQQNAPIVIKADGLAAGKGVTIARTVEEAIAAAESAMVGKVFGDSGAEIVVEDFMEGEEASFFALSDGKNVRYFTSAQDHKAAFDGDKGPNTGGMGAYSPAPIVDDAMRDRIMKEIIEPTVAEMRKMGRPFTGVLFAGLMLTKAGPRLIEYNCRFGDPETEVMLPRLKSDFLELLVACSEGKLDKATMEWDEQSALGVVMAADGYPGNYLKGSVIRGLEHASTMEDVMVYHAGTARGQKGEILANGGRVLCVTAVGKNVYDAQKLAYQAIDKIEWPEGFFRRDIGWRVVSRRKNR